MMKLIFILGWLLSSIIVVGQTTISGKITDNKGEVIVGANVFIKDSYDGTSTDVDGKYSFTTDEQGKHIIIFSYIGHENYQQEIELNGGSIELSPKLKSNVQQLDVVTISAGSIEASDEKKSVILRPLDIVTTAGASGDIYGALKTLPGAQNVGEQTGLFVRGGDATEAKTFIDGTMVRHPFYSGEPEIQQRGRFSPFLFKGTIFSTGGYSAEYGQAMSSALILDSQDMAEATSSNISIMSVGAGFGHEHRWKNTSIGFNTFYANLKPYFAVAKQLTDWDKAPEGMDGSFIFRQKTSKTGLFKIYGNFNRGSSAMFFPSEDDVTKKSKFELGNSNLYFNGSYKEILNKKWSLQSGISHSRNIDDIKINDLDILAKDDYSQGKIKLIRQIGKLSKIRFGGEVHKLFDHREYGPDALNLEDIYSSTFAESDIYLSEKLVARVGGRFEHSQILDDINFAPRTSLAYKTGENSQLSFAYGDFYQAPEARGLIQTSSMKFEHATHYIFNYQRIAEKRAFRFETYYKEYNNLLKYYPDTVSQGGGYAKGIDIFWRDRKTFKYVDYWISYSYLDTKRDYRWYTEQAIPTFAATHTFTTVYKQWIDKLNASFGFTYSFSSGRTYYNPNNSVFLGDKTPNYHDLSINFSYLTMIKGNFTVLVASVGNALGIDNIYGYRYSADGSENYAIRSPSLRTFFIGMFMNIGKDEFED